MTRTAHLPSRRRATRRGSIGALFIAPAAITVLALFIVPLGLLGAMSLSDWPLLGSPTFTGVDNYLAVAGNERFLQSMLFTLVYTVLTTIAMFSLSVVLVAIAQAPRRGARFYRTAYFLPFVIGTATASLMWLVNYNDQVGIYPHVLRQLDIIDGSAGFLATPTAALYSVIVMVTWKFIGFQVVVLLVGLQSIAPELYEAARCDGANAFQRLRYITIPQLRPTIALLVILSVTGSLLAFEQFFIMTQGGPDNSTITMVMSIYNTAFTTYDLGRAAALSIVLLVALVAVNAIQLRVLKERDS